MGKKFSVILIQPKSKSSKYLLRYANNEENKESERRADHSNDHSSSAIPLIELPLKRKLEKKENHFPITSINGEKVTLNKRTTAPLEVYGSMKLSPTIA